MSEDLAHDAHLRAALRHAPDHALSPPSGLSQSILAAARLAHRPPRATVAPSPVRMRAAGRRTLGDWLQRLFAPRWAGAWAAGLVAALGLGLWFDLELQPVVDGRAEPSVRTEPPAAQAVPDTARSSAPPGDGPVDEARDAALAKSGAPPIAAPAPDTPHSMGMARNATGRDAQRAGTQRGEGVGGEAQRRAAKGASSDALERQQAATPPLAKSPAAAPATPSAAATGAAALEPVPEARRHAPALAMNEESRVRQLDAQPAAPVAPASRGVDRAPSVASPALTLLQRARAELAAGSARWTWAVPGSPVMAPLDDAAQAWLARVVQAARGRWADVSERGESLDALEVRWWRDGRPHATLRIEDDGLRWIEPSGRIRYAPLEAGALQRLRSF